MNRYQSLSLYRKVQIFAVAFLLLNQVGGFVLASSLGADTKEILIGLGVEMVGATFTAMAVAYLDKSFTMVFDNKYGDPLQAELTGIKQQLTNLAQQMTAFNEVHAQSATAQTQIDMQRQLQNIAKQNQQLAAYVQHISHHQD